ncbi:hypothetical protein KI387_041652, partial [Taxus chinensis]
MRIVISLPAFCSKMSINYSIPHFQKPSFSNFTRKFSTGLTGVYPPPRGFCRNHSSFLSRILASKSPANPRRNVRIQPNKNWLRAKHSVKQAGEPSIISEPFGSVEDIELSESQAIGVAVAAQANFMRVIVKKAGGGGGLDELRNPSSKEDIAPGNCIDSGENIQVNGGIDGKAVNGALETRGAVTDNDGNGHSRISMPFSAINGDKVDRTAEVDTDRNLDAYDISKGRAAMDVTPEGYEIENDASVLGENVHKGTEDSGGSIKELEDERVGTELLCVVRALLKKMRRRVLVGDNVLVGGIDWTDKRGMIEDVFERKSEITDPPVANVDHMLVLFSMDQPKLEPFIMTRFLVEAESAEIPFTLAMNKTDLVEEE